MPIPAVDPLPEYLAAGDTAETYADIRRTLRVPWVGVLFLVWARYPGFLRALWGGLAPVAATRVFAEAAAELRAVLDAGVDALAPPPIVGRLRSAGYAPRELDQIRSLLRVLDHGNNQYALVAAMARLCMEGPGFGRSRTMEHREDMAVRDAPPLVLVELHHAGPDLRGVYETVMRTVDLPFLNTDYRALARWPSYFAAAWSDLQPVVGTAAHEALAAAYHAAAVDLAAEMPNPIGLDAAMLHDAAEADAGVGELREVCRLFQYLLPGLVTNMAFLERQLVE